MHKGPKFDLEEFKKKNMLEPELFEDGKRREKTIQAQQEGLLQAGEIKRDSNCVSITDFFYKIEKDTIVVWTSICVFYSHIGKIQY